MQGAGQSIGQNTGQSTDQSASQSIVQNAGQSTGQSVSQGAKSPVRIIKRFEVGVKEAEAINGQVGSVKGGLVLITRDKDGVADIVSKKIRQLGYQTAMLEVPGYESGEAESGKSEDTTVYQINEADEPLIEGIFRKLAAAHTLVGFVHVSSVTDVSEVSGFDTVQQKILKTIFLCAKNFVNYSEPGAIRRFFVSAARMDGYLGIGAGTFGAGGKQDRSSDSGAGTSASAGAAAFGTGGKQDRGSGTGAGATASTGAGTFVAGGKQNESLGNGAGTPASVPFIQGGLFGLQKSLNIEWDGDIFSKGVDISSDLSAEQAAEYLMEEIFATESDHVEIARAADGKRRILSLTEKYAETPETQDKEPGPKDVFLVTGGGRGITADCVVKVAEKYKCRFILLGRTDITADISWAEENRDKTELRRLAMTKLKGSSGAKSVPKPAEVNRMVDAALNQMGVIDTLEKIQKAGGQARYFSCDVTDYQALKKIVAECEAGFGAVTGLVHGAGNIADKKIQRKTAADFDNVFGVKILGLEACLKSVDPDRLKYLILFSSIAGYFGNAGQSDYAMANEVMNKFVFDFKQRQQSCKAISINWGLWDAGMVSDSIKLAIKGTETRLIPIETGVGYFMEQFRYTQEQGICQIVVNCSGCLIRPEFSFTEAV